MHTQYLPCQEQQSESIACAGRLLGAGGLVAIPTETVYGLAANALDAQAVGRIFAAKGRPQDNPLIVHIAALDQLAPLVREVSPRAFALAEAFWPGPLTMILPRSDLVPDVVSASLPTVAVRMPSHPVAAAIIRASGLPLAAPSANLSGRPSPTTAADVLADLDGRIDAVVDGGPCQVGVESTVVDLTAPTARLLRPGGITPEQLRAVLGELEIDPAVLGRMQSTRASSPGMKYQHYAPRAEVTILNGSLPQFQAYIEAHPRPGLFALCFDGEEDVLGIPAVSYGRQDDAAQQASCLFHALRTLDEKGAKTVYARCPNPSGVGLAVFNRLQRAAAFRIIELDQKG